MFKSKIFAISLLSLLISPFESVIAEVTKDTPKDPLINLFVPPSNEFTVGGVFLRPSGSNDYAVLVSPFNPNVPAPILSPSWETKAINAGFSPGFLLNYRHVFANSDNDINLYWLHLRTSDSNNITANTSAPPAQQMTGPVWNIGPDAGPTSRANGQMKNSFDVFNIEFGKQVKLGQNLQSRFFAGLSGLWLQHKIIGNFGGTDPILGPYTFGITTHSKYKALGLRLGVDGEYKPINYFSIVGLFAGNLYVGSQNPSTTTTGTGSILTAGGIPVNNQSISHDNYMQIVPAIDAKLGLKFSHQYSDSMSFAIEAGYMASIYINAIQDYVPSTYVPGSLGIVSGSVYLQSLLKSTNSFALDGPYIQFSMKV
jgi:hypothetical protein